MDLHGKVAIVTGAARGIGRAVALKLARHGADVVIADVDLDSARVYGEALAAPGVPDEVRALGRRSLGVQGDLCDAAAAQALVQQAVDAFGRLDILVNNAGGALTPVERSLASQVPPEDLAAMWQLNLMTAVHCSQAAMPALRAAGGGSIVNIASRAALDPAQRQGRLTGYGLAKGALVQYTRHLAHEVGPWGVRVNAVAPGAIATARLQATAAARNIGTAADVSGIPLRRLGTADDVAGAVLFLASDASAYVTGQCLSVCGGTVLTPS
jgi:NAD(P)-dependent dehydrogenase (short-subunit alcohol dehydrogenase family)